MLGVIGWQKSTSGAWVLREYITFNEGGYQLRDNNGPWFPEVGDVFEDSAGNVDTVTQVEQDVYTTYWRGIGGSGAGAPTWVGGWATVTRARPAKSPNAVNFRGIATAIDKPAGARTDLTVNGGNVIVDDAFAANTQAYAPTGWAYASHIFVEPQSSLIEIRGAHWHAPQGVKTLYNSHATNSFVVKHDDASLDENAIDLPLNVDITVAPGESVKFVRDNRTGVDVWRALRNSPAINDSMIQGPGNTMVQGADTMVETV